MPYIFRGLFPVKEIVFKHYPSGIWGFVTLTINVWLNIFWLFFPAMTMPHPSRFQTFRTNTLWKAPKNVHGASSLGTKDFVSVAFAQIFGTFKLLEKKSFQIRTSPPDKQLPWQIWYKTGHFYSVKPRFVWFPNTEDTMRSFFALSLVLALVVSSADAKRTIIALFKESKYGKFPHIFGFPVSKEFSLSS